MSWLKRIPGVLPTLVSGALIAADLPLEHLKLPPGFAIEVWARVDNPRQMALGKHDSGGGTLFAGSMQAGKVHAIQYGAAFKAQATTLLADGLQRPVGVAYKNGRLYVSAVSRNLPFYAIDHQYRPACRLDRCVDRLDLPDQVFRHRRPVRFVRGEPVVAKSFALGIENDGLVVCLVVAFEPA